MGPKINDLNPILSKNSRPAAVIKSLRFALFFFQDTNHQYISVNAEYVIVVLVLNVIRYSCHYFLDRILFHHDFHHDSCDYH